MTTARKTLQNREIDIAVLVFLWRWKICSTTCLILRFYVDRKPYSAYKRIKNLNKQGLIDFQTDQRGTGFGWSLSRKGFEFVRERIPSLREQGFKSENVEHDFIATAFHLGNFIVDCPSNIAFFTEQEMRRFDQELFPHWYPKYLNHRPDGITLIENGSEHRLVALEVERNLKRDSDYYDVGDKYARYPQINRVLWLTQRKSDAQRMFSVFLKCEPQNAEKHSFFLESEFRKYGWNAPCALGADENKTISDILGRLAGAKLPREYALRLLDNRKCRVKIET